MKTLGQCVEFVLKHRKGNAFKDYEEHHIASDLLMCSNEGTMFYAVNPVGELCGVVTAIANVDKKIMYVRDILAIERWVLPTFVRMFKERFPDYTITASRRCKERTYNTVRLVNKILSRKV